MGNYSAAGIPLDTIWSDIDFMDAYRDFTVDPVAFPLPKLQSFVARLHKQQQHYVVIVDPGTLLCRSGGCSVPSNVEVGWGGAQESKCRLEAGPTREARLQTCS